MASKDTYQNVAYGDEGSEVSSMQKLLVSAGYSVGPSGIDGIFGPDTLKAVKKFQKDNSIKQTGVYNYETMTALVDATTAKSTSSSSSKKTKKKKQPSLTLVKKDEKTIVVTNTEGKKETITYVLGVPASVSGIGSLSASYTKEFTDEEIGLLKTVAFNQKREYSSSLAYDELVKSVNNYSKTTSKQNSSVDFATSYSTDAKGAHGTGTISTHYTIKDTSDSSKYNESLVGNENQTETPTIDVPGSYNEFYRVGISSTRNALIHSLGLYEATTSEYLRMTSRSYNRFKMATPDSQLRSSFAHVFFVKPSCNIPYEEGGTVLDTTFQNNEEFNYIWKHSPELIRELADDRSNTNSDFSFVLSNAAASFSLTDEQIETDSYGKSFIGYKIAFGRHDVESKSAGEFSVTFHDDRDLHIYQLIKLWINYISGTYRGMYAPKDSTILDHIMDYAGACYYILTAEDGETILFWSKYYGVFPKTIPSNQYSWAYGNLLSTPQLDVSFVYSFKEDYNPAALLEFNKNSHIGDLIPSSGAVTYEEIYDKNLGHVGSTWVGVPFIETISKDGRISYKLRFRPGPNYG